MSYNVIVHPSAKKEIIAIKKWCRAKKQGLEIDFVNELKSNINLLKQNPLLFQVKYNSLRAIALKRFPYLVYYSFNNNTVYIQAVIASKQDQQTILTK